MLFKVDWSQPRSDQIWESDHKSENSPFKWNTNNWNNNKHRFNPSHKVFSMHSLFFLQITNLEKNVQNLKVQLAGAHGNHKEAMDQVI